MDPDLRAPMGHAPRAASFYSPERRFIGIRGLLFAALYCAAHFFQQIAEFFAPIALIAGLIWKIAPSLANLLADKAKIVSAQSDINLGPLDNIVPSHLSFSGLTLTASNLVFDGFLMMLVAAIASTVAVYAGRRI